MSKGKFITAVLFSAWGLVAFTGSAFATDTLPALTPDNPHVKPPGAVGSYTVNGTFRWIIPGRDAEVTDFSGMTRDEIFKKIQMPPEAEAKIVHQVPQVSEVIIDGITHKPEDIHLFDGQQLGFTVGTDTRLYAFTTEDGFQAFKQKQLEGTIAAAGTLLVDSVYSHYYDAWYLGTPVLYLDYQSSLATLLSGWDNIISSLEVNTSCYATRLYDYMGFGGDYFEALAGTTHNVLFFYGWNDRASSVLHY